MFPSCAEIRMSLITGFVLSVMKFTTVDVTVVLSAFVVVTLKKYFVYF